LKISVKKPTFHELWEKGWCENIVQKVCPDKKIRLNNYCPETVAGVEGFYQKNDVSESLGKNEVTV
jgi:hypothetical protein